MAITGPDNKKKKRGEAGPLDIFGGMFGGSMFGGFDDMMHQMQSSMVGQLLPTHAAFTFCSC